MPEISKLNVNNTVYDLKAMASNIAPTISKVYTSTSYYGTGDNDESTTWYFMKVRPDSWYKPWKVHFKVRSYCPTHLDRDSVTYSTLSGRTTEVIYSNWNETINSAHYYINMYRLTQTGFNNGLAHAVGISIRYGNNYTNSGYYRTFEVDYYDCEGCTIEIFDIPLKWSQWENGTTTNYTGLSRLDAVNRGKKESGDSDTTGSDYTHSGHLINGGDFRLAPNSLFGFDKNSKVQGISLYSSEYTGSTTAISTARVYNTVGFDWSRGIYYSNSGTNFAKNANIDISPAYSRINVDLRYSDNCVALDNNTTTTQALSLPHRCNVYLKGIIKEDGYFYLQPFNVTYNNTTYKRVWTITVPTSIEKNSDGYQYVYWYIGQGYYNGNYQNNGYQVNLLPENKIYWYCDSAFREYISSKISDGNSGEGVTDVTINGASVVQNGVASVPMATSDEIGLIKPNVGVGTNITRSGILIGVTRTAQQVKDEIYGQMIISSGTLKNVLASPSIMPALTDAEKAAARERIGVSIPKIGTITLPANSWEANLSPSLDLKYYESTTVVPVPTGLTSYKIDLQPSDSVIKRMIADKIVTMFAYGNKICTYPKSPTRDIIVQYTITEVEE